MGITIFASGRLNRIADLPLLINDLKVRAQKDAWTVHIIDDDYSTEPDGELIHEPGRRGSGIKGSLGLKGVIMNIEPGAEPLPLLFDKAGILTDLMQQLFWIEAEGRHERFTICKTQFGNIESHISVIEILDILRKKYISNLKVTDEGDYWDCRDRRILAEKRISLGKYLRQTEIIIRELQSPDDQAQDADLLALRIEDALLDAESKEKNDD